MLKTGKKILCTLLVVIMCLTSAPLDGFIGIEWPKLPEINFGKIELPKLEFSSWFGNKASALATTGQCGDNVYWSYDSANGELLISGTGAIYDYYSDFPSPFMNSDITSVVIKNGVERIGCQTFVDCTNLISVTIPDSVNCLSNGAFYGCTRLDNITIPDSVLVIEDSTFCNCTSLANIEIPDSIEYIGSSVFENCVNLTTIDIPDSITQIDNGLFAGCSNLKNILIPDKVITIDRRAFLNCTSITSIRIPDSVKWIWQSAFEGCTNLTSVYLGNGITSIDHNVFYKCNNIDSVYITSIESWLKISFSQWYATPLYNGGADLYLNNDLVTNVVVPDSITSINSRAFMNCKSLESIQLSNSISKIGKDAFDSCESLTSINIPDSVTSIGEGAFSECLSLTNAIIGAGVTSIDNDLFSWCKNLISVNLPESIVSIGEEAFYNCSSLASIEIPDSVTSIGKSAFQGCSNMKYAILGDSVTKIADDMFSYCKNLINVTMPKSVKSIGKNAFYNCLSIENLEIPDGVIEIGSCAFKNCENLTNISIPDLVASIETNAFSFCRKLVTITIPRSVISIGDSAFYACGNLADVYFKGAEEQWNAVVVASDNDCLLNATIHFLEDEEHTHVEMEIPAVSATCTTSGNKAGVKCSVCGKILKVVEEIPALGHDYAGIWVVDVEPTCTTNGLKSRHCNRCDEKIDIMVIDAYGHRYDENWTIDKEATCTDDGSKSHHCNFCNKKTEITVIKALGHIYSDYTETLPTCTEQGFKKFICTLCEESITETIEMLGHYYDTNWTIDKMATCTANGSKSHHCTRCNEKTDITVIEKLGHSYNDYIETLPTCTEAGTKQYECTVCKETGTEPIDPLGHDYEENWTVDKEATCTESGSQSRHCKRCEEKTDVTEISKTAHIDEDENNICDKCNIEIKNGYAVGDTVKFGSYPQTEVKDDALIAKLNALAPEWDDWTSYGYYSGNGNYGSMVQGDWMRYTDVTYNGSKYRGVKFTKYRPYHTTLSCFNNINNSHFTYNTYQDENGYTINVVYWFKFEPIKWRIIEPNSGFVMCESIIDSQPFSNVVYHNSNIDSRYAYFNDSSYTNFASDYETSSIRQWLNNDFYNNAFIGGEQKEINTTILNNDGFYTSTGTTGYEELDSNETSDKIFLLSYNELINNNLVFGEKYGFNHNRQAQGSDYAKCQGLLVGLNDDDSVGYGSSLWLLRSPGNYSCYSCYVDAHSFLYKEASVHYCYKGIRPALRCNLDKIVNSSGSQEPSNPSIPENTNDNFKFTQATYNIYAGSNNQPTMGDIALHYKADEDVLSSFNESLVDVEVEDTDILGIKSVIVDKLTQKDTAIVYYTLTALKPGSTKITAKLADGTTATCEVVVDQSNEMKISIADVGTYCQAEGYFFDAYGNYSGGTIDVDFSLENKLLDKCKFTIEDEEVKANLVFKNIKVELELEGNGFVFKKTKSKNDTLEYTNIAFGEKIQESISIIATKDIGDFSEGSKVKLKYKVYFDDYETGENTEKVSSDISFTVESYKYKYIMEHIESLSENGSFRGMVTNSFVSRMMPIEKEWTSTWTEIMGRNIIDNFVALFTDFNEVNAYEIVIADILSLLSTQKEESYKLYGESIFDFCSIMWDSLLGTFGENYINSVYQKLGGDDSDFGQKELMNALLGKSKDEAVNETIEELIKSDKFVSAFDEAYIFSDLINNGLKIIGITKDTITGWRNAAVLASACKTYDETLKSNEYILELLKESAIKNKNYDLEKALTNYLEYDNSDKLKNFIDRLAETMVFASGSLIQCGAEFLVKKLASEAVEKVTSVIGAAVAGFDAGRMLSDILCNCNDYSDAICAVVAAGYISNSLFGVIAKLLEDTGMNKNNDTGYQNAKYLNSALEMFKTIEKYACQKTVAALQAEGSSVVGKHLEKTSKKDYTSAISDVLALDASLKNIKCHNVDLAEIYDKIILQLGYNAPSNKEEEKTQYKVLCVQCPVDVLITNSKGEVVAQIVNDEIVSQIEGIGIVVYEDEKYICVPDTDEYNIIITATDVGEMDYTVFEYKENGDNIREVEYSNIPLYNGQKFTGKVDKLNLAKSDNYNLTTDSKTIYADKDEYVLSEGHKYTASIIKATCTENGKRVYTCTCGDTYTETITTSGHSLGVWYTVTPATCEAYGVEQRDCLVCDYSETQNIPTTGHNFDGSICTNCGFDKAESCGCKCHKTGFITKLIWKITIFFNKLLKRNQICECGVVHYGTIDNKAEHTHSYIREETLSPTCETDGLSTYLCACGESYTEVIPASHAMVIDEGKTVAPTCIADGVSAMICSLCGYSETAVLTSKGHIMNNGVCSVCGYSKIAECDCKCHETGIVSKLVWKISVLLNKFLRKNQVCYCGVYHY